VANEPKYLKSGLETDQMQEAVVDIQTRDGVMNTYTFRPDGDGPFPVVIHYMDSVGVREELSDMCRRLATVGYYVIMPNLYYRMVLNRSLSNTMIEQDTQALFDFLDSEPAARKGKLGVVGYCMSGRFVFRVAGAFPDRVAASASIYGARLITDQPDSAHLLAAKIKGEMYFACAEHDNYVTAETLDQIRAIIKDTGINASIEIYPEAEHGFAFPARRLYHKASSERHWERLFAMFRRNL
jgi:carboxymethylenebutenolidase